MPHPSLKRKVSYLKTVRILIIGDIHYPDYLTLNIDKKDPKFPSSLERKIATTKLAASVQAVAAEAEKKDFDLRLFVGDLTSSANFEAYGDCVKYILLNIIRGARDTAFFVPGNHDVDRKQYNDSGAQYKIIRSMLRKGKLGWELPIEKPIKTSYKNVEIWQLNSCVGCGANRGFPEPIQDILEGRTKKSIFEDWFLWFSKKHTKIDVFKKEFEGLDTPAFEQVHITQIIKEMDKSPNVAPIILTHHNLWFFWECYGTYKYGAI